MFVVIKPRKISITVTYYQRCFYLQVQFTSILYLFQVLGALVTGSGFEDVVYQSGLCTAGSLQRVLA